MAVLNTVVALSRPLGIIDYLLVGSPAITDTFYTRNAGSRDEVVKKILVLFTTPAGVLSQQFLQIRFNPIGPVSLGSPASVLSYQVAAPRGGSLAASTRFALIIAPDPESVSELTSFSYAVDADFTLLTVAHDSFVLQANNGQMIFRHASTNRLTDVQLFVYLEGL